MLTSKTGMTSSTVSRACISRRSLSIPINSCTSSISSCWEDFRPSSSKASYAKGRLEVSTAPNNVVRGICLSARYGRRGSSGAEALP